jgi:hypothetical protein
MSVKASTNHYPLDALMILQPAGGSNITATGQSANAIKLDVLTAYWNTGDVATLFDFAVVLEVTAWDHTTGDETYVVTAETSPVAGFGSGVVTVATQAITGLGRYQVVIDRDAIISALGANPTDGYLRLTTTLAGTTPILNYSAYASPIPGNG